MNSRSKGSKSTFGSIVVSVLILGLLSVIGRIMFYLPGAAAGLAVGVGIILMLSIFSLIYVKRILLMALIVLFASSYYIQAYPPGHPGCELSLKDCEWYPWSKTPEKNWRTYGKSYGRFCGNKIFSSKVILVNGECVEVQ